EVKDVGASATLETVDRVNRRARGFLRGVVEEDVIVGTAVEFIRSHTTGDLVRTGTTGDEVITVVAEQDVGTSTTVDLVVTRAGEDSVRLVSNTGVAGFRVNGGSCDHRRRRATR